MKISAVICELNPFHRGHAHILGKARENSEVVIAVMSGNFVQRATTSVYHKYLRAQAAVEGGADLCVELPFPFSSSSAEFFARAGVEVAEGLLATDLYFGSECGDASALKTAARILDSEDRVQKGRAAEHRAALIKEKFPDCPESIYSSPNDILGVEYCRFATINIHPQKRISCESASQIREVLYTEDENALSPNELTLLEFHAFKTMKNPPVFAECNGGVGGRLCNAAELTNDSNKWLELAKTKRYTDARLRRAALFALTSVMPEDIRQHVAFTRVLCANEKGREYLRAVKGKTEIPVITNPSDRAALSGEGLRQYKAAEHADKLYSLCAKFEDPAFFSKIHPKML